MDVGGRAEVDQGNRKTGRWAGLLLKTLKIPNKKLSWILSKECSLKEYIFFSANPPPPPTTRQPSVCKYIPKEITSIKVEPYLTEIIVSTSVIKLPDVIRISWKHDNIKR